MSIWIAVHDARKIIIGLLQGTYTTSSSDMDRSVLYIKVHCVQRPPNIIVIHIRHAHIIQDLLNLMVFLVKRSLQSSSNPTRINAVSI